MLAYCENLPRAKIINSRLIGTNRNHMAHSQRTRIKALCGLIFGILWLTPDSVLVRLYSCGVLTQLMYKNLWFSIMCIPLVFIEKGGIRRGVEGAIAAGPWLVVQGGIFTVTQMCFTYSITNTAAATTLVLLASSPLFSAAIGRVFLKEPLKASTLMAMIGGAIGVGIVFVGNLTTTTTTTMTTEDTHVNLNSSATAAASTLAPPNEIVGIILGLCTAFSLAIYLNVQRYTSVLRPNASETAGLILVGPICCVIGLIAGEQQMNEPMDMLWAFLQGGVVGPIAFGAFALAPRYLLASEVGLVQLLETVLGPVWVFVGGFETPPIETVWGGLVLLATLAAYFVKELCWDDQKLSQDDDTNTVTKTKKEKADAVTTSASENEKNNEVVESKAIDVVLL